MDIFENLDADTKAIVRKLRPLQQSVLLQPLVGEVDYERRVEMYNEWQQKQKVEEEAEPEEVVHEPEWPPEESEGCDADAGDCFS